jgi:hypothetical protein
MIEPIIIPLERLNEVSLVADPPRSRPENSARPRSEVIEVRRSLRIKQRPAPYYGASQKIAIERLKSTISEVRKNLIINKIFFYF